MLLRHEQILNTLASDKNTSVSELSNLLNVSEVTIRNDLKNLAKDGKVIRIHGGARLAEERMRLEFTFQTRKNQNAVNKQKIGKLAASLVNPMDSILIDSSTTSVAMAQALVRREGLKEVTVIPTGIWTALELMSSESINILLPGGYLRHTTGSITGVQSSLFFKNLNVQKAFLGAWGISSKMGVMDGHLLEVEMKKYILSIVPEVIILVDSSKFSQTGLAAFAEPGHISTIITDAQSPEKELLKFQHMGVKVMIAD